MTINYTMCPTHVIHESIITQLQSYAPLLEIIDPLRIKTPFDNRGDALSTGDLTPTNILVYAVDNGEDKNSVGMTLWSYDLAISVCTAQDIPAGSSELPTPLITPHLLQGALVGAIWYAFYNYEITVPIVNGLKGTSQNFIYLGQEKGDADTSDWFQDTFVFHLPYYRDTYINPFVTT